VKKRYLEEVLKIRKSDHGNLHQSFCTLADMYHTAYFLLKEFKALSPEIEQNFIKLRTIVRNHYTVSWKDETHDNSGDLSSSVTYSDTDTLEIGESPVKTQNNNNLKNVTHTPFVPKIGFSSADSVLGSYSETDVSQPSESDDPSTSSQGYKPIFGFPFGHRAAANDKNVAKNLNFNK
jgi:hypothetical protein